MKITLSTYETPGLSGNFLRAKQIGFGLTQNGCSVTLLTSSSSPRLLPKWYFISDQLRICESPGLLKRRFRHGGVDPYDFIWRILILLFIRTDIFHAFNPKINSAIPTLIVGTLKNKPLFFDWADLWGTGGIRELKKKFFLSSISSYIEMTLETWLPQYFDSVTCISHSMEAYWKKQKKQTVYMPVGSAPDIKPISQKIARNTLQFPVSKTIIGFTFTDSPDIVFLEKILTLLEAHSKKIQFVLMGPSQPQFKQFSNVLFNDFVNRNQMSIYLSACDFCILPFQDKKINRFRYPNKIGDYLAANKPFLTNPTGDIEQLIDTYDIGWLINADPSDFASKIVELSKLKSEILIKKQKVITAAQEITWKNLTQDLKRSYSSSLISKNPR